VPLGHHWPSDLTVPVPVTTGSGPFPRRVVPWHGWHLCLPLHLLGSHVGLRHHRICRGHVGLRQCPWVWTVTTQRVVTASASTVGATLASPRHAAKPSMVAVGLTTPANVVTPRSPSDVVVQLSPPACACQPEASLTTPLFAPTSLDYQSFEDDPCSSPELEYEHPSLVVLLHSAYEVVSQLDRAEEFRLPSSEEDSLRDFLVDQIKSLQFVVEA
jgi:hypothetical protein